MKEPIGKITKKPYFPLTGGSVLDNGGCMNSTRQSIHGAPNKMLEDARTALGNQSALDGGGSMNANQFMGLRT